MQTDNSEQTRNDTFGSSVKGIYLDTSKTLQGAKNYATRNKIDNVYVRINGSLHTLIKAKKVENKWIDIKQ